MIVDFTRTQIAQTVLRYVRVDGLAHRSETKLVVALLLKRLPVHLALSFLLLRRVQQV